MNSGRRSLFPVTWAAFGALMVGALSLCYLIEENRVPHLGLAAWFLVWLFWIPLNRLISGLVARYPIERHRWKARIPSYILTGIVLIAALLTCRILLDRSFHLLEGSAFMGFRLRAFLIQSVVYDVLVYTSFLALAHASRYYRQYTERVVRGAQLEAQIAEIQLGFLKAQLQPHFLLNSLNLISGQLYEDVERADAMIADLGALLRATLENPDQHEIPLERELDLLELYLDIARIRFGPRLRVERDIGAATLEALVPSLLLQPLVENALRHGFSRHGSSHIVISATRDPYSLLISVEDNGPGLPGSRFPRHAEGIGLANTRRRLEQLYGPDHRFTLHNRPAGGTVVTVQIPFRPAAGSRLLAQREALLEHSDPDRRRRAAGA